MKINKLTPAFCVVENTSEEKIYVYNCFFSWPSDPFTIYWVAKHSNGADGFVIDGKRLCFKYAHESKWEDLNFLYENGEWLNTMRALSDKETKIIN